MYKIISPRVGTPGEKLVPTDGTNIQALLDGGFIAHIDSPKSAKTKTAPDATGPQE